MLIQGRYHPRPVEEIGHERASENISAGIPVPPVLEWNAKASLRPIWDLRRKSRAHGVAHHDPSLRAANLETSQAIRLRETATRSSSSGTCASNT